MAQRKRQSAPAQARRSKQDLTSGALQAARKALIEMQARRQAQRKMSLKERRAFDREYARKKDAELKAQLTQVNYLGFYTPRLHEGESRPALTPARRRAIRAAYKQAESLATGAVFAPYPTRSKSLRKEIAAQAKRLGGKATKRGVYLPKAEREFNADNAKLVRERDTGLWKMQVRKSYTDRRGVRHTIREDRYLAGAEALAAQEAKLDKRLSNIVLDKDERLRFTIGGPGGNVSKRSFKDIAGLKAYAKRYRKDSERAQATFLAGLTIYVAKRETPKARTYRVPTAWIDKRGYIREAAAENLYEGGLFPKPLETKRARRTPRRRNKG